MPRGVRTDAFNNWIIMINNNYDQIMHIDTMSGRLRFLRNLAQNIKGIGEKTIEDTLLEFEKSHY